MGSVCQDCGFQTFPPRADCPECMSGSFQFKEYSGKGTLYSYSRIDAPPTGFEDEAPYTIGLVELAEGGRALACIGDTIGAEEIEIGMEVQLVPRLLEEREDIRVLYTIEVRGTSWAKAPAPHPG